MALKQKNELYAEAVKRLTAELEEKREVEASTTSRLVELETQAKYDKEKLTSLNHDYKNREKEVANLKSRLEQS